MKRNALQLRSNLRIYEQQPSTATWNGNRKRKAVQLTVARRTNLCKSLRALVFRRSFRPNVGLQHPAGRLLGNPQIVQRSRLAVRPFPLDVVHVGLAILWLALQPTFQLQFRFPAQRTRPSSVRIGDVLVPFFGPQVQLKADRKSLKSRPKSNKYLMQFDFRNEVRSGCINKPSLIMKNIIWISKARWVSIIAI